MSRAERLIYGLFTLFFLFGAYVGETTLDVPNPFVLALGWFLFVASGTCALGFFLMATGD